MSGFFSSKSRRFCGVSRLATAAAAGGCAIGLTLAAFAQDMPQLRGSAGATGAVPTTMVRNDPVVTGTTATDSNAPIPQYRPFSPGALPEEDDLSGGPGGTNPFAGNTRRPADAATAAPARGVLLEEEEISTGTVRQGSVDSLDEERNIAARRDSERATAIEAGTRRADETPFAATGVRVGSFILRPSLQQGLEYTTNAAGSAGGGSDVLSETTLRLNAESDWSRHRASLDAFGTYRKSVRGTGFEELIGGADATAIFELGNDFLLNGALGFERRPEEATSAIDLPATASRPLRRTVTGSLGLEKALGNLRLGVTGNVERNGYGDAQLVGGGTLSQADRNQTLYTTTLRAGYQISPALQPFVEAEYGRRIYDQRLDSGGYARSANRYGARAGIEADLGEKLNGEFSAGFITERFDDSRLERLSALTLDGTVNWSPLRGTTISLDGSTEIEGSTTPGAPGSVLYAATLRASRELRANLTGNAALGASFRDYASSSDRDLTLSGEASLTYWLNRFAGITGRARHERLDSNIEGRDSRSTSVYLGLTLQR